MSPTYQEVFRKNLAEARRQRGMTQDALAHELRLHGLSWTQTTVAAIESGRRSVAAEEEKILMCVLVVHLAELLESREKVFISSSSSASPKAIQTLAHGSPVKLKTEKAPPPTSRKADIAWPGGVAEAKAASKLGVPREVLLDTCVLLWGRTLTEERESRAEKAGGLTTAQKGRVTRHLVAELKSAIDRDHASKPRRGR